MIWQGGGGGGLDEDIEGGGRQNFLDTWKGGSEKIVALGEGALKICILQNQEERGGGEGLLKNWTTSEGAAKILSFEFQYPHPHPLLSY